MSNFHIRPEFRMTVILPFRLGTEFSSHSASERRRQQRHAVEKLNRDVSEFTWHQVPFEDKTHKVPDFLAETKRSFIFGTCKEPTFSGISFATKHSLAGFTPRVVGESVLYYDWGLGAVELEVELTWNGSASSSEELSHARLTEFGGYLCDRRTANQLAFFKNWDDTSDRLASALGHRWRRFDMSPSAERSYFSNITLAVRCASAGEPGAIEMTQTQWRNFVSNFTGKSASEKVGFYWPGVLSVGEGTGGVLALLDGAHDEADRAAQRIAWLWRLAIIYLVKLENLRRDLREETQSLLATRRSASEGQIERIGRERLAIELVLQECSRATFCTTPLDNRIYQGMWEAWNMQLYVDEVKEHVQVLHQHVKEIIDFRRNRLQGANNLILLMLNIVVFASGLATVIATCDYLNKQFSSAARLLAIELSTGIFTIATFALYLTSQFIRAKKN